MVHIIAYRTYNMWTINYQVAPAIEKSAEEVDKTCDPALPQMCWMVEGEKEMSWPAIMLLNAPYQVGCGEHFLAFGSVSTQQTKKKKKKKLKH